VTPRDGIRRRPCRDCGEPYADPIGRATRCPPCRHAELEREIEYAFQRGYLLGLERGREQGRAELLPADELSWR